MTKKDLINFVKDNYFNILTPELGIHAVSIAGSRINGYAVKDSDLDILLFKNSEQQYSKKFLKLNKIPIEVHIIPIGLPGTLYQIFNNLFENKINIPKTLNRNILGSKQCYKIKNLYNENLAQTLFAWREFYKIWNSFPVWQHNGWFNNFYSKYAVLRPDVSKIKYEMSQLRDNNIPESVVTLIKLENLINKKAFSKVLYIDKYLYDKNDKRLDKFFRDIFSPPPKIPNSWKNYIIKFIQEVNLRFENESIGCRLCKGVNKDCSVGRGIEDYYDDYKKALHQNWIISSLCSLKKVENLLRKRANLINNFKLPYNAEWNSYWEKINLNKKNEFKKLIKYFLNNAERKS